MDIYEADDNSTPLMADLVLQKLEGKTLYWGDTNLVDVQKYAENILMLLEKQTQVIIQIC